MGRVDISCLVAIEKSGKVIENEPESDEETAARQAILCGDFVLAPGEQIQIEESSFDM
jgi:hypothetical protein